MPRQSRKNLTGEFFHLIVQGIKKELYKMKNYLEIY